MLTIYLCYNLVLQHPDKIITFHENQNIAYLVFQKENPYIEEPFLGMDDNYLYSYTDYIKLDSNYVCELSSRIDVEYRYRAQIVLISRYKKNPGSDNNPLILEKYYTIDDISDHIKGNKITVSRSYNLYLEPYKSELDAFAATIDLPVVNEVRVNFIMELKSSGDIESEFIRSINIPVSTEFYNITTIGEKSCTTDFNVPIKRLSSMMTAILSALIIASFAGGLLLIKRTKAQKKSSSQIQLEDYLRTYDDIIVSTVNPIDFSRYEEIYVKSFKELLTLSKRLSLPIMYFDNAENALFCILLNDVAHIFKLELTDD